MGRVLTVGDNYWTIVTDNLMKARKSWTHMMRILGRERAEPKIWGFSFKEVVQVVLIFGS